MLFTVPPTLIILVFAIVELILVLPFGERPEAYSDLMLNAPD